MAFQVLEKLDAILTKWAAVILLTPPAWPQEGHRDAQKVIATREHARISVLDSP